MAKHQLHLLVSFLFVTAIVASPSTSSSAKSLASPTATLLTAAPPTTSAPLTANSPTPTAYDMLEKYNLARGILPQGVTGYVLRPDGSFEVYLPSDCAFRAGSMQVRYSSRVAGTIRPASITGVEGVKVKVLLAWVAVREVDRVGDRLRFSDGPVSKSFPVGAFAHSPQCA
ncbi:unnamed protein product [Urochloa humidicola]